MSDHALLFTLPRSGPYEDDLALREAGFAPVPSTKGTGYSCWVRHVWGLSEWEVMNEIESIQEEFPNLMLIAVDEAAQIIYRAPQMTCPSPAAG